jgi:hypothetical protein
MRPLVAHFTLIGLNDAIAAIRELFAGAGCASPTGFRLAIGGATVARTRWIASFARFDSAVAAAEKRDALLGG